MTTKQTAVTRPVSNPGRRTAARRIPLPVLALAALLPLAASAQGEIPAAGRDVTLTFYPGDVALVQDRRDAAPPAGRGEVRWRGVAPGLHPGSVRLEGAGGTLLRGFALEHKPWSLAGLVEDHVGRQVRVVRGSGAEREEIRARVIAADPLLLESVNGVFSARPDQLVYPGGVPAGMGAEPALALELDREEGDDSALTLYYLAGGFAWSAEHVAVLSPENARMDLVTRARIRNDSGMTVRKARVHLIAGEVNIPRDGERRLVQQAMMRADTAAESSEVVPEAAGEQYRFRLPQPLALADGDSRSVRLRGHDGIAVERIHAVTAAVRPHARTGTGGWQRVPVETRLEWEQPDGPLPAGPIRVYEREADGLRLVGGDRVPDRPEGARVRIVPGRPFDLTAERRQTEFRRIDSRRYEVAHEIRLSNATGAAAEILVEETIPGDWEMLQAGDDWERAAANLAVWRVKVPAGGERSITYYVRINQ